MAKPIDPPQSGIIARTIKTIKTAMKVVVGVFLALILLGAWIASLKIPAPTPEPLPSPIASPPSVAANEPASVPILPTPAVAPTPIKPPETPAPVEEQEPVTVARPGGAGHAHVCIDRQAFDELQRLLKAIDEGRPNLARFSQLSEEGRVLRIPNGTHGVAIRTEGGARLVRLVEGYKSGQVGWVDSKYVTPASTAEPTPEPSRPTRATAPPPVDPEKRAATILGMGRNLERSGKTAAALENYRRVLAEFPNTVAASEAARKVEALGK